MVKMASEVFGGNKCDLEKEPWIAEFTNCVRTLLNSCHRGLGVYLLLAVMCNLMIVALFTGRGGPDPPPLQLQAHPAREAPRHAIPGLVQDLHEGSCAREDTQRITIPFGYEMNI